MPRKRALLATQVNQKRAKRIRSNSNTAGIQQNSFGVQCSMVTDSPLNSTIQNQTLPSETNPVTSQNMSCSTEQQHGTCSSFSGGPSFTGVDNQGITPNVHCITSPYLGTSTRDYGYQYNLGYDQNIGTTQYLDTTGYYHPQPQTQTTHVNYGPVCQDGIYTYPQAQIAPTYCPGGNPIQQHTLWQPQAQTASADQTAISGNSFNNNSISNTNSPFNSVCNDLSLHIPKKLKEQIWQGEFIDLSILLQKEEDGQQSIKLVNGELVISNAIKKNTVLNIERWTDAFLIYIHIMVTKSPLLAKHLLQYLNTIRLAAKRNPSGWAQYDKMFRRNIAQHPGTPWSVIDAELWLITMTANHNAFVPQYTQNICFDYNTKGFCNKPGCFYQHKCKKCRGNHPSYVCRAPSIRPDLGRGSTSITNSFRPRLFRPEIQPRFQPNQKPFGIRSNTNRHELPK